MKLEYDKDTDAAYVYLKFPIGDGEVKKTKQVHEDIMFDFDDKGKLIGVEILNASRVLNKEDLLAAEQLV